MAVVVGSALGAAVPATAQCGPGNGDCCQAHGTPGCDDVQCCLAVCALDPFCCHVQWDPVCASEAADLCGNLCPGPGVCGPGAGDCCIANGTPGCEDPICCESVCAVDPFCCDVSWDSICAVEAIALCGPPCDKALPHCPSDVDEDGGVGVTDLLLMLARWGPNPGNPADIDADGIVGVADLLALLGQWGVCPPLIRMMHPEQGARINGGTITVAHILPLDFPLDEIQSVEFQYSPDGVAYFTDDILLREEGRVVTALWDTGGLAGGNYFVRARVATVFGQFFSDVILVSVNEQPFPVADAQAIAPNVVLFNGLGSFDNDGVIVTYEWSFGDGEVAEGPIVQHQYAGPGPFSVRLTVGDDFGGLSSVNSLLTFVNPLIINFAEKTTCGCTSMNVLGAGAVVAPVARDPPVPDPFDFSPASASGIRPPHQGTLGGYNNGAAGNVLPGAGPWTVRFRFEVIATLREHSEPRLCAEGQRVQRTSSSAGGPGEHKNGNLSHTDPAYDSTEGEDDPYTGNPPDAPGVLEQGDCPHADATNWCDDDYHGGGGTSGSGRRDGPPNGYKAYDDQTRIMWLDAPGVSGLRAADLPYARDAKFDVKVKGNNGGCRCTFEIRIKVEMVAGVPTVTQNTLFNLSCNLE